jgi:hypothetical protein
MTNCDEDEEVIPPRPWRIEVYGEDITYIVDANGDHVVVTDCGFYPPNLKTAEFICKCVNEAES